MSQTVPYRLGIGGPKLRGEVDLTHTHGYRTLHIFVRDTPSEIAVVNFSTRELRPLIESCTGFGLGNFSLHCDFEEDGGIRVLIYYAPPRFAEIT